MIPKTCFSKEPLQAFKKGSHHVSASCSLFVLNLFYTSWKCPVGLANSWCCHNLPPHHFVMAGQPGMHVDIGSSSICLLRVWNQVWHSVRGVYFRKASFHLLSLPHVCWVSTSWLGALEFYKSTSFSFRKNSKATLVLYFIALFSSSFEFCLKDTFVVLDIFKSIKNIVQE